MSLERRSVEEVMEDLDLTRRQCDQYLRLINDQSTWPKALQRYFDTVSAKKTYDADVGEIVADFVRGTGKLTRVSPRPWYMRLFS